MEVTCDRCSRAGRYRVEALIKRCGAGCTDFLERLTLASETPIGGDGAQAD